MAEEGSLGRRRVAVASLWSASSILIPLLGTAALSIVMARVLGASDLGEQSLIAYIETTLASVLVYVTTDASIRAMAAASGAGDEDLQQRLARWSTIGIVGGGLVTGLVVGTIGLLSNNPLPWLLAALNSMVNGVGWSFGSRVIVARGWSPVAARRLLWQTVAQALGIAFVLFGSGITGVFVANLISSAALAVMLVRIATPLHRGPMRPFPAAAVRVWLQFLAVAVLTQIVTQRVEFLFLGAFSTTQQIAMYSVAFMLFNSFSLLATAAFETGMPSVAEAAGGGRLADTVRQLAPALRVTALTTPALVAYIVTLGPPLLLLLYGPEFKDATYLVPIMAVAALVTPIGGICLFFWMGVGRLHRVIVAAVIAGILDLATAAALVPSKGAVGAALANTVGQGVFSTLLVIATWRAAGRFPVPWGRWAVSLVLAGAVAAAGWAIAERGPWIGLLAGGALATAVLGGFGLLRGYVAADDASWLRSSVPERLHVVSRLVTGPR